MMVDLILYMYFSAHLVDYGLFLVARSVFALVLLVTIRITTPRLKLETLSRLGWLAGFGVLLFAVAPYVCVWFVL
jgi:NADH:ubiquinone oxidoreductase subunit H